MTETRLEKRVIGYARVSTVGQTLDSQLEQLRAAGCTTKIYREMVTGAHNDRRELLKMLKVLAPGDVVTVTRIDRDWVFEPLYYSSLDKLVGALDKEIIEPAEMRFDELVIRKAETMKGKHV
jgi:predicted site-specific integrase-resolvase